MKTRTIAYWITTGLLGLVLLGGGVADLSHAQPVAETLAHLGFPAYVATLLGTWKLLGALAILAPRLARVKEWAYAGIVFDLTGAIVSHASVGDGLDRLVPPLVLLTLAATSWALRPASRILASDPAAPSRTRDASLRDAQPSLA